MAKNISLKKIKTDLAKARNHYDNELIKIEKIWANLKPHEYTRRQSLVKAISGMTEIDQTIKMWENKLK